MERGTHALRGCLKTRVGPLGPRMEGVSPSHPSHLWAAEDRTKGFQTASKAVYQRGCTSYRGGPRLRWAKRGEKRGNGTVRRADGFDSAAFSATSASTKPPKRSDRLLCNRQAGQFSGSTWLSWLSWLSWQSWWPKGKPQLTAAKSTVSTSRASEDAERV